MSARPDVALTIDVGETPDRARALSIRGRAGAEIVAGVPEEYLAGARKLWTPKRRAQFEQNCCEMYAHMAHRVHSALGALRRLRRRRLPRFLQDLALAERNQS